MLLLYVSLAYITLKLGGNNSNNVFVLQVVVIVVILGLSCFHLYFIVNLCEELHWFDRDLHESVHCFSKVGYCPTNI